VYGSTCRLQPIMAALSKANATCSLLLESVVQVSYGAAPCHDILTQLSQGFNFAHFNFIQLPSLPNSNCFVYTLMGTLVSEETKCFSPVVHIMCSSTTYLYFMPSHLKSQTTIFLQLKMQFGSMDSKSSLNSLHLRIVLSYIIFVFLLKGKKCFLFWIRFVFFR
jgi:hypothetical protein